MDLSAKHENESIYRYYSMPVFLRTLKDKELAFIDPLKWEDPYEDFIRKSITIDEDSYEFLETKRMEYEGKLLGEKILTPDVRGSRFIKAFGQCWTLKEESDALWRRYAQNNDGVRVRTTPNKMRKVITTANKSSGEEPRYFLFQGAVLYFSDDRIKRYVEETVVELGSLQRDANIVYMIIPLLIKRLLFSHEEEYRFLVAFNRRQISRNPELANSGFFKIPFEPNELFEEVMLAPAINRSVPDISDIYVKALRDLGYAKDIKKSTSYDLPVPPSTNSVIKLIIEKGINLLPEPKKNPY